jgi:hypothetical protein
MNAFRCARPCIRYWTVSRAALIAENLALWQQLAVY